MGSIFAGICIFFSASFVGIWLKKRTLKKLSFYRSYYDFLSFASDKIAYERMVFSEIVRTFHSESREFSEVLSGGEPSFGLPDGEIAAVKEYLSGIGKTDAETQIASLRGKSAEIKALLDRDGAKWKKDASLYFKLSVLLGVALFIILV